MAELFVVMTVQKTLPSGDLGTATWTGRVTPEPRANRQTVYEAIKEHAVPEKYPDFRDGVVLFYSAEPLDLKASHA